MNSEDLQNLLTRIDERLANHVERYDRDREETKDEAAKDKVERDTWRNGIEVKIEGLDQKFTPVLRDHQIIMRAGKWVTVAVTAVWAILKGWLFVKDHLK